MEDFVFMESSDALFELITEGAADTYVLRDNLYPKVEATLSTPEGNKAFRDRVRRYIDRNSEKLNTQGPVYVVPFGDTDKAEFFHIFDMTPKEITTKVIEVTRKISGSSNWKLITQNPIFILFYCCVRYYTLHKDETGVNTALAIYALSSYPSIMSKYFKYGANPAVMQYTIDKMTEKFMIKQKHTVFATLCASISNSYKFLQNDFVTMTDIKVLKFVQRIRNDQNSLMKKIASEFHKNYQDKKAIRTASDNFNQDGDLIVDNENDTTMVERIANKSAIGMLSSGIDLARAEAAGKIGGVSVSETRNYLTKVFTNKNVDDIKQFIESIIYMYTFVDKHSEQEINSKTFLLWASELYRKTNSNDANIKRIKTMLDTWAETIGVYEKYKREASRNCYKKAIFMYIILMIQRYN